MTTKQNPVAGQEMIDSKVLLHVFQIYFEPEFLVIHIYDEGR
jgi:hypothetical protein